MHLNRVHTGIFVRFGLFFAFVLLLRCLVDVNGNFITDSLIDVSGVIIRTVVSSFFGEKYHHQNYCGDDNERSNLHVRWKEKGELSNTHSHKQTHTQWDRENTVDTPKRSE